MLTLIKIEYVALTKEQTTYDTQDKKSLGDRKESAAKRGAK